MPRGGQRGGRGTGTRPPVKKQGKPATPRSDADAFMRDLIARMDGCPTAESLNDEVIMPFVLALEKVLGARGYVMNIYGETANLVFTGSGEDAEAIYQIVEAYLDDQNDD